MDAIGSVASARYRCDLGLDTPLLALAEACPSDSSAGSAEKMRPCRLPSLLIVASRLHAFTLKWSSWMRACAGIERRQCRSVLLVKKCRVGLHRACVFFNAWMAGTAMQSKRVLCALFGRPTRRLHL